MSETNRKLHGENTSTTRAFHELEKKDMIKVRDTTKYRGRVFSKYWLSGRGIGFALLNGANPEITKNIALSINKDKMDKTIENYFELREVSPKIGNALDTLLVLNGSLTPEEIIGYMLVRLSSLEEAEKSRFFETIKGSKEFDEALEHFKKTMRKFVNGEKT